MKKVVVGYDGTDESKDALRLGRVIAKATGATLCVACSHEREQPLQNLQEADEHRVREMHRVREIARTFEEAARELSYQPFEEYTATGSAAKGIAATAERIGADLIVVGSSHRGKLGRIYPGSVGERLLSGTRCAVAVAPRGFARRPEGASGVIGVGYDGRPESKVALTWAIELAQAMGSVLRLIAVVPNASDEPHVGDDGSHLQDIRDDFLECVAAAEAHLPQGIRATSVIDEGDPADVLAERGKDVDLMVVGSRAYGAFRYALLGGVSHQLMREAPCPLMVVPKGAARVRVDATEVLLVGVEKVEESRDALRFARNFAAATEAEVHAIAVLGYEACDLGDEEYDRIHEAHFDQVMAMADEELGGECTQHRVTDLSPAYAITKLAEELEASAIVIGSSHRGPIGRLALGSTGTTLASGSPCPVIVAPRGYGKGYRPKFFRIGVAYNGTPESEVALREATEIARRMDGRLHLIGVVPHLLSPARIGGTDRGFERMLKEETDSRLQAAAKIYEVEGDDVELRVGRVADELAEASADLDLLVIGSRSYGPLGRVLLGGVANKLMRSAACPVVVIPRGSEVTNGESDILATLLP